MKIFRKYMSVIVAFMIVLSGLNIHIPVSHAASTSKPTLTITTKNDQFIGGSQSLFQITGTVVDLDGDPVVVSAQIGGITKSIRVTNTRSSKGWSLSWHKDEFSEGEYGGAIPITADDGINGTDTKTYQARLMVDKTPPAPPTMELSEDDWTDQDVLVTITPPASDSGSPIGQLHYIYEGVYPYDRPFAVRKEGITEIKGFVYDLAGNRSEFITKEVKIVKTPPTAPQIILSSPTGNANGWTKDDVSFVISGSTGYSNITYEYKLDNGNYQQGDRGVVTKEGVTRITARAVNELGMVSPETETNISIDNTDPVIELTPNGREWSSDPIRAKVNVTDAVSGIQPNSVYYKVTSSRDLPNDWEVLIDPEIEIDSEGQWYVHVKAADAAGNTSTFTSNPFKLQYQPQPPRSIVASNVQNDNITLTWDLPDGQSLTDGVKYRIKNLVTQAAYEVSYPVNSITDRGLLGGRQYTYEVEILNHVGQQSSKSTVILTRPDAPEQLEVKKVDRDYSRAYLTFKPSSGANAYRIIVTNNQTGLTVIDDTSPTSSYMIEGLDPGTIYSISVHGINDTGQGPGNSVGYLSLPDMPGGFSHTSIDQNTITLGWNSVTGATYYSLDRFDQLIYEGPELTFKDTGLEQGTLYNYRVSAGNDTGHGEYANLNDLVTLPAKPNAQITGATSDSLTVSWAPVQGAESYMVTSSNGDQYITNSHAHTITGLNAGQEYEITVTAQNRSGKGESVTVSALTIPNQPDGITVQSIEESTAEISWNPVVGADKYLVQIEGKAYEVSGNKLQLNGLSGSKNYSFTVAAGNGSGYGLATGGQFLTKPHAPSSLKIKALSASEMTLGWEKDETAIRYYAQIVGSSDVMEVTRPEVLLKNLKPGKSYDVDVWTYNSSGESKKGRITAMTKTMPVAPDSIVVTVEEDQVIIEFTPAENAKEHVLLDENGTEVWRGSQGPITLTPITPGTEYDYSLVAENEQGIKSDPTEVSFVTIPDRPAGIVIEEVTEDYVVFDLSKANKIGAEELVINRDGIYVGDIKSTEEKYTDKGLEAGKTYKYEFKNRNESGTSSQAEIIEVRTLPAAPSGVSLKNVTESSATFDLSKVNADGIERLIISRDGNQIDSIMLDQKEFTDQGLEAGKSYVYEFKVLSDYGHISKAKNIKVLTLPAAPSGVTLKNVTESSVTFDLSNVVAEGAERLMISREGKRLETITLDQNEFTDKGLEAGSIYKYKFVAANESGTSAKAETLEVLTLPAAPSGIAVKNVAESSVTFDLSKVVAEGTDRLIISRDGKQLESITLDQKEFSDKGLEPGKFYVYEFKGENKSGMSKAALYEIQTKKTTVSDGGAGGGGIGGSEPNGSNPVPEPEKPKPEPEKPTPTEPDPEEIEEGPESNNNNQTVNFEDIGNSYAKGYIDELARRGIVKGVSETKFEPGRPITRMEFVSMVVRALELQASGRKEVTFEDVDLESWYAQEFLAAWDNEVAHGFSKTAFRPHDLINREQASKMLGNVLEAKSEDKEVPFIDGDKISVWARGEVRGLTEKQLVTGYPDGTFRPKSNLTRAESATLIYRTIMNKPM